MHVRQGIHRSIGVLLVLDLAIVWADLFPDAGSVGAAAHEVTLSLAVAHTAYPHDALVPVTITLTNGTTRLISTWDCLEVSLLAQAVGRDGRAWYPPLMPPPGGPYSACSHRGHYVRRGVTVAPGQSLVRHQYVMLRTMNIRAHVELLVRPGEKKPESIDTPFQHIRTVQKPGPTLILHRRPVWADAAPVAGGGPLLFSQYSRCRGKGGTRYDLSAVRSHWRWASGNLFRPLMGPVCRTVVEWHLFVAQVNRPVARVDYCGGRDCAYPNRRSFLYYP